MTTNLERVEAWHREWLDSDGDSAMRKWGDRINWITAEEIARKLDQQDAPTPESCQQAPAGWYCTRQAGHDGPCAAHRGP